MQHQTISEQVLSSPPLLVSSHAQSYKYLNAHVKPLVEPIRGEARGIIVVFVDANHHTTTKVRSSPVS